MNQLFNNFNRIEESHFEVKRNLANDEEGLIGGSSRHSLRNCIYLLPLIFLLLSLLTGISLLIFNGKFENQDIAESQASINYLQHNLKLAPFEDISTIAQASACPTGFTDESLGAWKGTQSGCLCKDGSVHSKTACELKSPSECKYSSNLDSKEFKIFKASKFCGKRFAAWKSVASTESCDSFGMTKCQQTICVKGTVCPITSLTLQTGSASTADERAFGSNKLLLARDNSKSPLVSLEIQESGLPCISKASLQPLTSDGKGYPLAAVPQKGCGDYGNTQKFSTEIDKDTVENVYKDNGFLAEINNLPFFWDFVPKTENAGLYSIQRVPIKGTAQCSNVDANGLNTIKSANSKTHEEVRIISIIVIVFSAIGLALVLAFLAFRTQIRVLAKKCTFFIILACCLIVIILACILFGLYIHNQNHDSNSSAKNHFKSLQDNKCIENNSFDRALTSINKFGAESWKSISWLVIFLFSLSCAFFVLLLISLIVRKSKKLALFPDPRF